MQDDILMIKMKNNRIEVIVSRLANYMDVKEMLFKKLDALSKFFGKDTMKIVISGKKFTEGQEKELATILKRDYGLDNVEYCTLEELRHLDIPKKPPVPIKSNTMNLKPKIIRSNGIDSVFKVGNVRGGQVIQSHGDITIIGDVNPSAQLVAKGNICVVGTLRGNVHAGAFGDKTAIIVSTVLEAKQIRIANCIGIAPKDNKSSGSVEIAHVVDDIIVIEPINEKPKKKSKFLFKK